MRPCLQDVVSLEIPIRTVKGMADDWIDVVVVFDDFFMILMMEENLNIQFPCLLAAFKNAFRIKRTDTQERSSLPCKA